MSYYSPTTYSFINLSGRQRRGVTRKCSSLLKLPTLEKPESLFSASGGPSGRGFYFKYVETNCFWQWPTLSYGYNITFFHIFESRRAVCCYVLVAFLITTVFCLEVQIITANNDGVLHLGWNNNTFKNTATDGNVASERALLVDVCTFNSAFWGLKAKANVTVVTSSGLRLFDQRRLLTYKYRILLLNAFLVCSAMSVWFSLLSYVAIRARCFCFGYDSGCGGVAKQDESCVARCTTRNGALSCCCLLWCWYCSKNISVQLTRHKMDFNCCLLT